MAPHTRAFKRARRTVEVPEGDISPLAKLPWDVYPLIFEHSAASDGAFAALRLSHVSRAWRELVLKTPSLWKDARFSHFPRPRSELKDPQVAYLLRLCAQRSGNALTHVELRSFRDIKVFRSCLEVVALSATTLTDLTLDENDICRRGKGASAEHSEDAQPELAKLARTVQEILSRSHQLDRLFLDIYSYDIPRFPGPCVARPRELTIISPMQCCQDDPALYDDDIDYGSDMEEEPNHLTGDLTFFAELASGVERLVLDDPRPWGNAWPLWALERLVQRSPYLRTCHLYTDVGVSMAALPQTLQFPLLEELAISDVSRTSFREFRQTWQQALQKPAWLEAPALRRLHATPSIAEKITAPSLESVRLVIHNERDVEVLPAVLASWPDLESLTIEIYSGGNLKMEYQDSVVQNVVRILDVAQDYDAHCLELRHVGILVEGIRRENGHALREKVIDWASAPWSPEETDWYTPSWHSPRDGHPHLGGIEIMQLDLQRRLRSMEGDPESGAPPRRPPCFPLQSIKLGGVKMDPRTWQQLVEHSDARISCRPEPREADKPSGRAG